MSVKILIVDDEQAYVESVVRMLRIEGYTDLTPLTDPSQAPPLLSDAAFDIAFLDITMPQMGGLDLLKQIKERSPHTECIMVTANDSIPMVIKAVRLGAYDYLVKPIMPDQLVHALNRALERKRLVESLLLRSTAAVNRTLKNPAAFEQIITADKTMIRLLHEAELHAPSDVPILITGETGVGKEVLARAIHLASRRANGPFVPINMLALTPSLFESEFFGHAKGSFTGADRAHPGFLAQAQGGTLFMDEIGDLPSEIQGKLLRVLQEKEFIPVGKTTPDRADVRFIAATNQDLDKLVQQRKFRKDLYYRLQIARLPLPPLRERRQDIPLLTARMLQDCQQPCPAVNEEAQDLLNEYHWPGNVRELKGALEAAANLAEGGVITTAHLKIRIKPLPALVAAKLSTGALEPLAEVERRHILAVYEAVGSNKSRAARVLNIGLQTLQRKLKVYQVN
jgi:DNA-binding NtrC family response regulator